jgi:hypothetical protein
MKKLVSGHESNTHIGEDKMNVLKTLTIVTALLAGGSSLAMAQNGLPTGGYPPVMGGAGGNPAVPGFAYLPEGRPSYVASGGAYHHTIKHHRVIYDSAKTRQ